LGFVFEGILRQHMIAKGRNRDTAIFSMLEIEWPRLRAAFERWLAPDNFDTDGRQKTRLRELSGVVTTARDTTSGHSPLSATE